MEKGKVESSGGRMFTIGLVVAWYSSNVGVLLLNKYLLSNYGFRYPIFLTMCHMTACSLLSYVAIAWMKIVPMQAVKSGLQLRNIAVLSFVFCGSIVSGNMLLRYLPVYFNQAVGATTPFFAALFAYIGFGECEIGRLGEVKIAWKNVSERVEIGRQILFLKMISLESGLAPNQT